MSLNTYDNLGWQSKDPSSGGLYYESGYQANYTYSQGFYSPNASLGIESANGVYMSVNSAPVGGDYAVSYAPNDPSLANQWSLSNIGVYGAWDYNQGGRSDVKVAVIDTGVTVVGDLVGTHFDMTNAWDFVNNDATVTDGHGHGTFVTSEIAAVTNNGQGIAGIAYNTTILPIKALSDSGSGSDTSVANAINQAVAAGADIISMSLGGGYSALIQQACQNAYNHGVLVVAAAGNEGQAYLSYPAGYDTVLAVGSTTSSNTLSSFSNHAADMVVAPGSSILGMTQTGAYQYWNGTSMATPEVSAAAALLLSEAMDLGLSSLPGENSARVEWLINILETTTTDLGTAGQDSTYGYGKIQADRALASIQTGAGGDDYAGDASTTGAVTIGGAAYGSIGTAGDQDWFAVSLSAGRNYQISLEGSATSQGTLADPYLYIYDSAGTLVTQADNGGTGNNSRLVLRPDASGTYYLGAAASGSGTGSYRISVSATDDYAGNTSTSGVLTSASAINGELETTGDRDWFKVNLVAGNYYYFDLQGANSGVGTLVDPYLFFYNSAGTLVSYDDDSGNGYESRLTYSATQNGTFYLAAAAYGDRSTGTYRISMGTFSDDYVAGTNTGGQISAGGTISGSIERSSDADWFRTSLEAGFAYQVDLKGASSGSGTLANPYLSLYDSAGTRLTYVDNGGTGYDSRLLYTPAATGTYFLGATASGSGTGTYQISLTKLTDDYAAATSTTGTVDVGATTTGTINRGGDADWFALNLTAGTEYYLSVMGTSSNSGTLANPYLTLYNSAGTRLSYIDNGGAGNDSRLAYTATTSGTYYLAASSASTAGTGTYQAGLEADDYKASTATTGAVTVGGTATGKVQRAGESDWFAVDLSAGGPEYIFEVRGASSGGGTLGDAYLTLYNSAGTRLTYSDAGGVGKDARLGYTALASGTYYVAASGSANTTGTYTVAVSQDDYTGATSTTGAVAVGGTTTGSIQRFGDVDWFRTSLEAGFAYQIDLQGSATSAGTLANPYLTLYNSAGARLTYIDNGGTGNDSRLVYTTATAGNYYLAASASGNNAAGTYQLGVTKLTDDFAAATSTVGTLDVGATITGTIDRGGDADWLAVNLTAGTEYYLSVKGASSSSGTLVNPYLTLYNSAGTRLTYADNGGAGYDSRLAYTAATTGTYYLAASAASATATGTYLAGLEADDYKASIATTGAVTVGGTATGTVQRAGEVDWFAVDLSAGGPEYIFEVRGTSSGGGTLSDAYLTLYNSNGIRLTYTDGGGTGKDARVAYAPAASGTYYLAATGSYSTTGTYTVAVSQDDYTGTKATTGVVAVGGTATGDVQRFGDVDWFKTNLEAGFAYQIDLQGSATSAGTLANPFLGLYNSAGTLITSVDNGGTGYDSRLVYTTTAAGDYYLAASASGNNAVGTYQLGVTKLSDDQAAAVSTTGNVGVASATGGTIDRSGDADWFAVNLTAGTEYYLSVLGASSGAGTLVNPYLTLYNSAGARLTYIDNGGTGYDSRLIYTAATTGTYYLAASSGTAGGTGTYQVSLEADDYKAGIATTGAVSAGATVAGNVQRGGDADWFRISLTAGTIYTFDLMGASSGAGTLANPYLSLYNSAGAIITSADNGGVGSDSRLTYTATGSGTFYLGASAGTSSGTGTYELAVAQDDYAGGTNTSASMSIPIDSTRVYRSGTLEKAGDRDWFRVTMTVGYSFHFDVEGADTGQGTLSDPYIYLYNSAGTTVLASADGGGTGLNAHLDYNPTTTGTYYVAVGAAADSGTGTYRLTAWDPPIVAEEPSGLSAALETTLALVSNAGGAAATGDALTGTTATGAGDAASTGSGAATGAGAGSATTLAATEQTPATGAGGSTTTAPATTTTAATTATTPSTGTLAAAAGSDIATPSLTAPSTSAAAPLLAAA